MICSDDNRGDIWQLFPEITDFQAFSDDFWQKLPRATLPIVKLSRLRWADTKKASKWLANYSSDVSMVGLSPKSIAYIIKIFESQQVESEFEGETLFRDDMALKDEDDKHRHR